MGLNDQRIRAAHKNTAGKACCDLAIEASPSLSRTNDFAKMPLDAHMSLQDENKPLLVNGAGTLFVDCSIVGIEYAEGRQALEPNLRLQSASTAHPRLTQTHIKTRDIDYHPSLESVGSQMMAILIIEGLILHILSHRFPVD
ncbi:hypothetical protein DW352_18055 [Pseudolabrys taiwanensis]|uniref:Uncharacterized protein n=1 Tax=Pseudolabrys taiwanensis TaxID=331696 RepID=A0A345ZZB1_9HYPH|nr:hypothetical protein [Pseudolabrys taiwanensis]AXK82258.1 hypothetical protein DW352_18055 [Pseudolabrys taiwanensis]